MELRRIVVGLDFAHDGARLTPGSVRALAVARRLASGPWSASGLTVTLMHSDRDDERWSDRFRGYLRVSRQTPEGLDALVAPEVAALRADGAEVRVVTSEEPADLAITRHVLREGADLVIVGKRAEGHGDGRKLGSVSKKLVHECPCAVWVAKPDGRESPQCVLAASDLGSVAARALAVAAELAAVSEAELHVVHAFGLPLDVQLAGGDAEADYVARQRRECLAALEAQLASTPMAGKAKLHVGLSSPSHAVLTCADRLAPDLVVLGTVGRGGIAGLLVGNTAERLLDVLDASILAVKPTDFVCPVLADASAQ